MKLQVWAGASELKIAVADLFVIGLIWALFIHSFEFHKLARARRSRR